MDVTFWTVVIKVGGVSPLGGGVGVSTPGGGVGVSGVGVGITVSGLVQVVVLGGLVPAAFTALTSKIFRPMFKLDIVTLWDVLLPMFIHWPLFMRTSKCVGVPPMADAPQVRDRLLVWLAVATRFNGMAGGLGRAAWVVKVVSGSL